MEILKKLKRPQAIYVGLEAIAQDHWVRNQSRRKDYSLEVDKALTLEQVRRNDPRRQDEDARQQARAVFMQEIQEEGKQRLIKKIADQSLEEATKPTDINARKGSYSKVMKDLEDQFSSSPTPVLLSDAIAEKRAREN